MSLSFAAIQRPQNREKTVALFQKGKSGNPGGRPKAEGEVRELAKKHTAEAVERLVHWMRSENPKASPSACVALLDRAWGKPAQAITGEDGAPLTITFIRKDENVL